MWAGSSMRWAYSLSALRLLGLTRPQGEHTIQIDHDLLGQTCGLLPVGIDSTILTTSGLRWNLSAAIPSSYVKNI